MTEEQPKQPGHPDPNATRWGAVALAAAAGVFTIAALSLLSDQDRLVVSVLLGLLVPTLLLRGWLLFLGVGVAVGCWLLGVSWVEHAPPLVDTSPQVSSAVGAAAYFDIPYRDAQVGAALAFALPLAIGLLFALGPRRLRAPPEFGRRPQPIDRSTPVGRISAVVLIATGLVALTLAPDLQTYIFEDAAQPLGPASWDRSNLLLWENLIDRGLFPMRDFFYPYGGQWLFQLVPAGILIRWLAQAAMLVVAAWSLWRLSGRRTARVVICLLAIVVVGTWSELMWRYLPALLVAISYAALGPAQHRQPTTGHLVFGAALLLAALLEPNVLIFGLAGAATVLAGAVLGRPAPNTPGLLRGVVVDSAPAAAAVVLMLGVWTATGSVEGNLRFFGGLGTASEAFGVQELAGPLPTYGLTTPLTGLSVDPSPISLRVAIPFLLLAAGLVQVLLGDRRHHHLGLILLAGAGVTFVYVLKHLVRFVGDPLLAIPLLVLVWSAVLAWDSRRLVLAAATGSFLTAAVFTLQSVPTAPWFIPPSTPRPDDHAVSTYLGQVAGAPVRIVRSALIPFKLDAVGDARKQRFRIEQFDDWLVDLAVLKEVRSVLGKSDQEFAVLGDAQLLYVFLEQDPPYQASLFDASPVGEQRAMVDALRDQQTPYLIWRPGVDLDRVPYQVRVPLVFEYAIRNYVPQRRGTLVDVLRLRRDGEPTSLNYWQSALGSTVDLGYIPSFSAADEAAGCSDGVGCVDYATLEGGEARQGQVLSFTVSDRGHEFSVWMRARNGVGSYPVRLDRLWFWSLLGSDPSVQSTSPGWSVRTETVRAGDDLY